MGAQPREVKVLTALSASMTIGFIVMMALGDNPPPAGAFCLASYYHLEPSESVISSVPPGSLKSWKRIEVSHIRIRTASQENAEGSDTNDLTTLNGSHFLICNGIIGGNGQIKATRIWQEQQIASQQDQEPEEQTIHICVIVSGNVNRPTDLQIKRVEALVTTLSREFGIGPNCISYGEWQ